MSNQHVLKIHPAPLADLMSGAKTAEVRRNDRGFQVGDTVRLMEVNPETGNWTGAADQVCTITHIQTGYGLPDEMCVLSYGKVGHDYKAHWMGFMDRTDWMQEKGQVPAKYLGQHRADILTDMLREAREALARVEAELAEALGEIRIYQQKFRYIAEGGSFYLSTAAECVRLTSSFLAMHANTPETQGAQAGDELDAIAEAIFNADKDNWYSVGPYPQLHANDKARLRAMARAALATQPADERAREMGYRSAINALDDLDRYKMAMSPATAAPEATKQQLNDLNNFFNSVCEGGLHSVEKAGIQSLTELGALENCGFGRHRLTRFGTYLLDQNAVRGAEHE